MTRPTDIVQQIKDRKQYRPYPLPTERQKPEIKTLDLQGMGDITIIKPTEEEMRRTPAMLIAGVLYAILHLLREWRLEWRQDTRIKEEADERRHMERQLKRETVVIVEPDNSKLIAAIQEVKQAIDDKEVSVQAPPSHVSHDGTGLGQPIQVAKSKREIAIDWLIANDWRRGAREAHSRMKEQGIKIGRGTVQRAINELRNTDG
jgi:arginine repressor